MHRNHNQNQSPAVTLIFGIFAICFGIFWTVTAASMAPFMAIFGIFFIALAVTITVNGYKSANKAQEQKEEPKVVYQQREPEEYKAPKELRCPYCGAPIHKNDRRCEYCDSRL